MKKLVSVLLALTLCSSLVVPAFAEPTEEPLAPEESGVLTTEEVHEHEGEVGCTVFSYGCELSDLTWEKVEAEDGVKKVAYVTGPMPINPMNELSIMPQATLGNCPLCGKNNWSAGVPQDPYDYGMTSSTHTAYFLVAYVCLTAGCISVKYNEGRRTESHSLQKGAFTGNHYHVEGSAKHMAEYEYNCSVCGYSTTKWEYYICPGGSGGGCLYPTSLDEEELMGGVTVPEDVCQQLMTIDDFNANIDEDHTSVYVCCIEDSDIANLEAGSHVCHFGADLNGEPEGYLYESMGEDQHRIYGKYVAKCLVSGCTQSKIMAVEIGTGSHSYNRKGNLIGAQSVDGSTHKATYSYSCVCGKAKTESVTESHSLRKGAFTGNHYHVEGSAKHMAEYQYTCSGCGYSTTRWEYYTCPGGSGGGCLYPTSLDEEELMGDVTGPEDAAEPAEEPPTPEETTPLEVAAPEEGEDLTGEKEFAEDECEHWLADYDIEVTTPEGHTVTVTFWEPCDGSCEDPMLAAASSVATAQLSVPCPKCGKVDWDDGKVESVNLVNLNNKDVHGIDAVIVHECQTCHVKAKYTDKWSEPHSWQRGTFTGNHYHNKGDAYHHAEYEYHCPCGASKTQWDTYSCPGGRNDGNCLYPTSLDEEELMEDVTGPEDAALPKDVVLPEDVTTPEDAMEPDETATPGEITTPEETTGPEEPYE